MEGEEGEARWAAPALPEAGAVPAGRGEPTGFIPAAAPSTELRAEGAEQGASHWTGTGSPAGPVPLPRFPSPWLRVVVGDLETRHSKTFSEKTDAAYLAPCLKISHFWRRTS